MAVDNMTPKMWDEIMEGAIIAAGREHERRMASDPVYRAWSDEVDCRFDEALKTNGM